MVAAGALLASTAYAVTPVVVDGSDFVNAISGARFQMIGVAYVEEKPRQRHLLTCNTDTNPVVPLGSIPAVVSILSVTRPSA